MNNIFGFLIKLYQIFITPLFNALGLKSTCAFYPTCSEYAKEVFKKYNSFKATLLTIRRISRCHPWQKNHLDPA